MRNTLDISYGLEKITEGEHTAPAMDSMHMVADATRVDQRIQPRKAGTVPAL